MSEVTLSVEQPFGTFMAGALSAADTPSREASPTSAQNAAGPTADPTVTETTTETVTPLSGDLRKALASASDLGPSSTTRAVTRAQATLLIGATPATTVSTPAKRTGANSKKSIPGINVSTFEHFGLVPPPASGKESAAALGLRTAQNFIKLADIVGTLDGRFERLERHVENAETEQWVHAATRSLDTRPGADDAGPRDVATAPNSPRASDNGSLANVDEVEVLGERLEELDKQVADMAVKAAEHVARFEGLEDRIDDAERRVDQVAPRSFSLIKMSNAVAAQFTTVQADRDALYKAIRTLSADQAKINRQHAKNTTNLEDTVRALEATVARLELEPKAPLPHFHHPTRRVHSRSRSPDDAIAKRPRATPAAEDAPFVVMGPVKIQGSLTPLETFKFYMDAVLPSYVLPEQKCFEVTLDPMQVGHLRIKMISAPDARALALAWTKVGHGTIRTVLNGDDAAAGAHTQMADTPSSSVSGYRPREASNGNANGNYRRSSSRR
ncbi:hypothetical protein DFH09DRAFT_1400332 [Mycena vulgaris]|nr:hypothetical protein DFH09DRAFT_1400332 [Mycena vulgaris]